MTMEQSRWNSAGQETVAGLVTGLKKKSQSVCMNTLYSVTTKFLNKSRDLNNEALKEGVRRRRR